MDLTHIVQELKNFFSQEVIVASKNLIFSFNTLKYIPGS